MKKPSRKITLDTKVECIDTKLEFHLKNFDEFRERFDKYTDRSEDAMQGLNNAVSETKDQILKAFEVKNIQCTNHSADLTKLKRDRAWMYGIFTLLWGAAVAWLRYR